MYGTLAGLAGSENIGGIMDKRSNKKACKSQYTFRVEEINNGILGNLNIIIYDMKQFKLEL